MLAFCICLNSIAALGEQQELAPQLVQKSIEQRRSLGNYHIKCRVTGSSVGPKNEISSYVIEYEWIGINGKVIQHCKKTTATPESSIHSTICKGCIESDNFFFQNLLHSDAPIYSGVRNRIPQSVTDPMAIGLSLKNISAVREENLAFLLKSNSFKPWEIVKTDPITGNVQLTRSSTRGHGIDTVVLSPKMNYSILEYKFEGSGSSYTVSNKYENDRSEFPASVELNRTDMDYSLREVLTVSQAEFHLPENFYRFDASRVGLRYNSHVLLLDEPSKPAKLRYFDGKKLVTVCPDPREYVLEEETVSASPIVEQSSWKRILLLVCACILALLSLYFGTRFVRTRR